MKVGDKITVRQIRSGAGRVDSVKDTLKALGLGRIGKERIHTVNEPLFGMLKKVEHLISVKDAA